MMQYLDLGGAANDGTGTKLRLGGDMINDNFLEISDKILTQEFIVVRTMADFPTPVGDMITCGPDTTYFIIRSIDTLGKRFTLLSGTVFAGASSINSGLYSSVPLAGAMFTTTATIDWKNLTLESGSSALLSAVGNPSSDNIFISNCTFVNCDTLGTSSNYSSIIIDSCTFSNVGELDHSNTIGTFAINNCLGIPNPAKTLFKFNATATISRRIRCTNSSFILDGTSAAFDVNASATIPDERYIINGCAFTGASASYLLGVSSTSNKALFTANSGITNTVVIGQMYMQGNATATTIGSSNPVTPVFFKVSGTTTSGELSKYLMSITNRLTCDATVRRKFLVQCQLSFTSSNNQNIEFGFYDSTISGIRVPSRTTQNTGGAGVAANISLFSVINHAQGDYLELHVANNTSTASVTVVSMNIIISQI